MVAAFLFGATLCNSTAWAGDDSSLMTRRTLTGDWGGARSDLADDGVRLDLWTTGFWQGMFDGDGNKGGETGGRVDAMLNLDTGKMGLWKGGGLHTHFEYRSDSPTPFRGGALWPVNTAIVLPGGADYRIEATSLYLSQQFGETGRVMLGKINAVDLLAAHPFFGGWGTDRFMNLAFVAPPSGVVPPVFMGGVVSFSEAPWSFTLMVFDPNDQTRNYSFNGLFADGVNVTLGVSRALTVAGRPSSIGVSATCSSAEGLDYSTIGLPPGSETTTKRGSYNIAIELTHQLVQSADAPGKGIGLYLKGAVADGNPNPVQSSIIGGIGGSAFFAGRAEDSFGVGFFHYNFSDKLQDAVQPYVAFHDEQGMELFYDVAATPWFHITADLQVIDPATGENANAVVGGLRTKLVF